MSMTAEQLAKAICKAEGKNPDKIYKKKPLYEYSMGFANDILQHLPKQKAKPAASVISYNEKLKIGVQAYIEEFNNRTYGIMAFGKYVNVDQMKECALEIHTNSLKAAINAMLS